MDYLKPSELRFLLVMPFPGLLQKIELEHAAACIALAARASDAWDTWLEWDDVRTAILADADGAKLVENPFFRPNFHGLHERELLESEDGAPYGRARMRATSKLLDMIARQQTSAQPSEVSR